VLPSTTASLVAFLIFVAPGFLFELRRGRRVPRAERTTFREISSVALASVVCSGIAIALLAAVRAIHKSWMPDPSSWFADSHKYLTNHWPVVTWFLVIEVALACVVAYTGARWLPVRGAEGNLLRGTAWWHAFREVGTEHAKYVCVRMRSGAEYYGILETYTPDECDVAERELTLIQHGLAYRAKPEVEARLLDTQQRIVLHGAEIESITVKHLDRAEASDS
jgi:hypothetical protein